MPFELVKFDAETAPNRFGDTWSIRDTETGEWVRNARGARRAWSKKKTAEAALEALEEIEHQKTSGTYEDPPRPEDQGIL